MSNSIEHFTCLKWIKNQMKKQEGFTIGQVYQLQKRIKRSPSIYFLVSLIQELRDQIDRAMARYQELEKINEINFDKYQRAEERIIEEFGKKSYEYQVFKGEF